MQDAIVIPYSLLVAIGRYTGISILALGAIIVLLFVIPPTRRWIYAVRLSWRCRQLAGVVKDIDNVFAAMGSPRHTRRAFWRDFVANRRNAHEDLRAFAKEL